MNDKIKRLVALALSTFVLNTGVCAQKPEVTYDINSGSVSISGYTSEANTAVTIEILYPGKTIGDLANDGYDEVVRFFGQTISDDNKYWEKTFIFGADSGTYPVRVYEADEDKTYDEVLEFVSAEQINRILDSINSNPNTIQTIIEENIGLLGLDSDIYKALKNASANMSNGYANIAEDVPFTNISELKTSFDKNMLTEVFNEVDTTATLVGFIEKYSDILGVKEEKIYEDYLKLSADGKSKVTDSLNKNSYENIDDVADDILKKTVAYIIMSTSEWNRIYVVALEYTNQYSNKVTELNNIDFATYDSLSAERKYQAMSELIKTSASNLENWIDKFNELCIKWKSAVLPQNPTASGGGGGSSGGNSSKGNSSGIGNVSAAIQNMFTPSDDVIGFTDLNGALWAKEGIEILADMGIISGRSKEIFDPSTPVTREEFIKIIVSAFDLVEDGCVSSFTDVDSNAWYYKYVACAEAKGITVGNGDGSFGVGKKITREEMAAMLLRAIKAVGKEINAVNEHLEFNDCNKISEWASEAVKSLQMAGIISGMEDGNYSPKSNTTRAQAAVVVYKTLQILNKI